MPRYRLTWLKIGTEETQAFEVEHTCANHARTAAYNQFASWIGTDDRNAWMFIRMEKLST